MANERRSGSERRGIERANVSIDVEWEGAGGRESGTISDISAHGCFVMCSGGVADGENVRIFIPLSDGMKVQFLGEVVNHTLEIGFAARFTGLSDAQRDFLGKFIGTLRNES